MPGQLFTVSYVLEFSCYHKGCKKPAIQIQFPIEVMSPQIQKPLPVNTKTYNHPNGWNPQTYDPIIFKLSADNLL